jgi:5-methyltetrahydrofolate--homocysteine methyltransferase
MPQNVDGKAVYKMTPKEIAEKLEDFVQTYDSLRLIGGCCGTNPEHIAELHRMLSHQKKPASA